ncbi:DUF6261 family protein [Parabacteroides sp. OttesenSCG-928-G21]|nr:DUF6261 family protein [Parabacteroides sp. OttesenSCG-928-G21]
MTKFLETSVVDITELSTVYAAYKQLFDHEDLVFKHHSKMIGTQDVIKADRNRDNEFISVRMGIKSALRSTDPEIQAAAQLLMPIVDNYKAIPKKSYNEATAYVTNLIQEFLLITYQPSVTKLGMGPAVNLLDEANKAFEEVYNKRTNWLEKQKQQGNMEKIRPQVDEAFDLVVKIINSLYAVNEIGEKDANKREKLAAMIDEINAQLDNMARSIAYRKPGYSSPEPEPHPEPGPGPVEPFEFTAESQDFVGGGVTMLIKAPDPQAFHSALHDRAVGGIINFKTPEDPNRFTVTDFQYTEEQVAEGLLLQPTDGQDLLLSFSGPYITVELIKDEQVLAIIDRVKNPDGMA